ncbi:MAG: DNA-3-methyladenine glycosylase I [Deltaproteobacteria bacterium]|nr:DNA-3-methyladenine glycosylase I [Deltaproteobacteria bacterium]
MKSKYRCTWANQDSLAMDYHDLEWGVPVHDDRLLFEFLILEGAQAGLSWSTILRKREGYRRAFEDFNPARVAKYNETEIQKLLDNPGIIRNRRKIVAAVKNAQAFLKVKDDFGSFDQYVWRVVGGRPMQNSWKKIEKIPSRTRQSDEMSEDLKGRGFSFVGSTICYAFMQAVGMVNDHVTKCFRHEIVARMA